MRPLATRTISDLLRDQLAARQDAVFLQWEDDRYTFSDLERYSRELAEQLRRQGVRRGVRVALMMRNSPVYLWALVALGRMGAVGVPINFDAKGELLAHYLRDSEVDSAIVDVDLHTTLLEADRLSQLKNIWVRDGAEVKQASSDDLEGPTPSIELDCVAHSEPWLYLYTSGTTGRSKAVVCTHGHAVSTALIVADRCELVPEDCLHTCLPLFHLNAISYTCVAALSVGCRVALTDRFSVRNFWKDIRRHGATGTNVMGSMIHLLDKREASSEERDHDLRYVFLVPFPADPAAFEERYGAKIVTTYSLTEWIPVSLSKPGEGYDRPGQAGPLLEYTEVRIVDEAGVDLEIGEAGEIWLRSREEGATFKEYFQRSEESAAAFEDGWFKTHDRGRLDADGYLYFIDRIGDVIRRRGENISAKELEDVLRGYAPIKEIAAVPVPSSLGEDDVAVFVVLRDGVDAEALSEIGEYAAATLPRHMVPATVDQIAALPKTGTEKVEKYKLIEEWKRRHPSRSESVQGVPN